MIPITAMSACFLRQRGRIAFGIDTLAARQRAQVAAIRRGLLALVFSTITAVVFVGVANAGQLSEEDCSRLHPNITSPAEMVTCTSDLEGSEARLKQAYGALVKILTTKTEQALPSFKKAQSAWLKFRDAQCEYESAGRDGTMASSDTISCTANMNRRRAADLEANAKLWK